MRDNGRITDDAAGKLGLLAASTKNYTGAEIEGLVRSATSFAIGRNVDLDNLGDVDEDAIKVEWQDFERAIDETTAQFGAKDSEALEIHCRTPLIDYGSSYSDIWGSVQRLLKQVKTSQHTPLMTVLLEGEKSTGKTAIAARLAKESGLSFIRMISAEELIGKSDRQRVDTLQKTFVDAYKSDTSLIFLDDIERLIDYSVGGFSNPLLQTLLILLNKVPPVAGRRLLVVGTTAMASRLEDLGLPQAFKVNLHVNRLQSADEVRHTLISRGLSEDEATAISDSLDVLENPIGIKQLLMVLEMARSTCEEDTMSVAHFMECMHTCGY
jgi:vesicle-fusing ATPase